MVVRGDGRSGGERVTADLLGWSSTATDTTDLNMSAARFAAAETTFIPLAVTFADRPPRPDEAPPVRLPRRLRRRVRALIWGPA